MVRHANAVNALGADAIVMLGDLVDDQVEDIGAIVDPVSIYSAPDGQFFAFGKTHKSQLWYVCRTVCTTGRGWAC